MSPRVMYTLVLAIIGGSLLGFTDVPNKSIEVLPHWEKDERVNLEITKARERVVNGKTAVIGKASTPFTLKVLQADENGYLVGWTPGETKIEGNALPEVSHQLQAINIMKGLQIVLQIDAQGTITGVRNWKELKEAVLKVMDGIMSAATDSPKGGLDSTQSAKLRAQVESIVATKEQVERFCVGEAQLYFLVLGRQYSMNEPFRYEDMLPNPLGGENFPTQATFALKSYDHKSKQAVITWQQVSDPKETARILAAMLNEMATSLGGKKPPEGEFPTMIAMEDRAEILVDVATGWVRSLSYARSVTVRGQVQVETTSIVRRAP